MKNAIIILADGFEEIEAVTPIDLLRRAGINVCVAGIHSDNNYITGSHGIRLRVDADLDSLSDNFDACILPGGQPGAANLAASDCVQSFIKSMHMKQKIIAAICAAPAVVLAPLGILDEKNATCFPGKETAFSKNTHFKTEKVVVDGHIITSRSAGTAIEFSLKIIELLINVQVADSIRAKILAG